MIYGIGTDLCDIGRIEQVLARHGERFVQRVLGPQEQQVFAARSARIARRGVSFLATRFAAKEAFSKAVGLGMRMPMTWRDCEVLNAPGGKPELRLHRELDRWFRSLQLRAHVSVSDEAGYASAFVVVERDPSP